MTTALASLALTQALRLHVQWRARPGVVTDMAWSPDARVLAIATRSGGVLLLDGATGAELALLTEHAGGAVSVAWRPCGTLLATSGNDGTMRCFDRSSLDLLVEVETRGTCARGLAWSNDGAYLAARTSGIPTVWSVGTSATPRPVKRRLARALAWHPTDRRLFVADATRISSIAIDGKPSPVTLTSRAPILSLATRPDAAFLAAITTQGPAVWDLATGGLCVVPDAPGASAQRGPAPIAWSPTMPWLVTARGGDLRIWPMREDHPSPPRWFPAHAGGITGLAPLPCGRRFVSSATDGAVHLWDVEQVPRPIATGRSPTPLTHLALAGSAVATASIDDRVTAWSV